MRVKGISSGLRLSDSGFNSRHLHHQSLLKLACSQLPRKRNLTWWAMLGYLSFQETVRSITFLSESYFPASKRFGMWRSSRRRKLRCCACSFASAKPRWMDRKSIAGGSATRTSRHTPRLTWKNGSRLLNCSATVPASCKYRGSSREKRTARQSGDEARFGTRLREQRIGFRQRRRREPLTVSPGRLALTLLTFQCFAPGGRIGVAKWNGADTPGKGSSNHAPCIPSGMLHTFLHGERLLDTIHLNLLNKEGVDDLLGGGWGKPAWEMPVNSAEIRRRSPTPRHIPRPAGTAQPRGAAGCQRAGHGPRQWTRLSALPGLS